uniref:INVERT_DEFENSINS domain-containing protein n=1 Tax=Parastrongyloides trichosuri TaxID=131310 RepID=A0A0N4Z1T1_PARTI
MKLLLLLFLIVISLNYAICRAGETPTARGNFHNLMIFFCSRDPKNCFNWCVSQGKDRGDCAKHTQGYLYCVCTPPYTKGEIHHG